MKTFQFKSHPELSRALVSCPFNALHLYYPNEIQQHMTECKDADRLTKPNYTTNIRGNVAVPTYASNIVNNDTEDWDDEGKRQEFVLLGPFF